MSELLDTCRAAAPGDARVTWVDDAFLLAEGVGEWMELPLWIADPALAAADQVNVGRAVAAGLAFRPLVETVRGALEQAETTEAAGLTPEPRGRAPRRVAWPRVRTTQARRSHRSSARSPARVSSSIFTTTREELERRFEALKTALDPADGLWIAWPKKVGEDRR